MQRNLIIDTVQNGICNVTTFTVISLYLQSMKVLREKQEELDTQAIFFKEQTGIQNVLIELEKK